MRAQFGRVRPTVQSHPSNILTKLKLQSRIQVAIAMAAQGA
jgi:DNA-binding NarL/FixJ family response regulator